MGIHADLADPVLIDLVGHEILIPSTEVEVYAPDGNAPAVVNVMVEAHDRQDGARGFRVRLRGEPAQLHDIGHALLGIPAEAPVEE